mgnify:CR=1 FL=1
MLTVTVYSTPNCMQCKATYRQLEKLGVGYTVVDLAAPENAELLTWIRPRTPTSVPGGKVTGGELSDSQIFRFPVLAASLGCPSEARG